VWEFFAERVELAQWPTEGPLDETVGLEVVTDKPAQPLAQ